MFSHHKAQRKLKEYGAQYVHIKISGRLAFVVVYMRAEANIMQNTTAKRLGLSYSPSSAQLRLTNAPPTLESRLVQGVSITINEWQGKSNFIFSPLDHFDIIFGQDFF